MAEASRPQIRRAPVVAAAGRESIDFGPLLVMDSVYPSPKGGGAESQVGTLGRWFNNNGYPCTLVTPMLTSGSNLPYEVIERLPIIRLSYPHVRFVGAAILQLKLILTILQHRDKVCAIHAHIGSWMAVTCCLMGKLLGLPVIVKMTGHTELVGGALDPDGNWLARLKRKGLSLATGYQAISSEIERAITQVGLPAEKILRIANAVDLSTFGLRLRDGPGSGKPVKRSKRKPADPLQPTLGQTGMIELDAISPAFFESNSPSDGELPPIAASGRRLTPLREDLCPGAEFVVLFSGRLEPVKRLDLLLRAWRDALAHDKKAWLVLVGGGSLRDELEAQARRYSIAERVVFVGQIARIADYIHAADILALVSDSEGLSNSMLEGMSGGLPVLGSSISGTEDFVTEYKTGWLFPPGDLPMLTRQLSAARATPARQLVEMSRAAHDEIVANASVQAVTRSLLDAYAQQRLQLEKR